MFKELANVLLLMLNLYENPTPLIESVIESEPQSLLTLASKKVAFLIKKNPSLIDQIPDVQFPEILFSMIGLIQMDPSTNSEIKPLHIRAKEHFTEKTFERLIDEHRKKLSPFILAVVCIKKEDKEVYNFYDAIRLNNHLFGENYEYNRFATTEKEFNDPISQLPINSINYFVIVNKKHSEATYLANDCDLLSNNPKEKLLRSFFQMLKENNANINKSFFKLMVSLGLKEKRATAYILRGIQNNRNKQIAEAIACYNSALSIDNNRKHELISLMRDQAREWQLEKNLAFARELYKFPADNGDLISQKKLAEIYCIEKNKDKAIHYAQMAAEQNDPESQNRLGVLVSQSNPEKALDCFIAAANQNDLDALGNLSTLYIQRKEVEKATECLHKLIDLAIKENSSMDYVNAQCKLIELQEPARQINGKLIMEVKEQFKEKVKEYRELSRSAGKKNPPRQAKKRRIYK